MVKRKDFLLFMYFSLFIHAPEKKQAEALSVKSWGRGCQTQAQRTKEWDNDSFVIPINSKGVYTRMNGCKILKDEDWLWIEAFSQQRKHEFYNNHKAYIQVKKFINQSQYQKYSYSTQSYFRIIFLRVLQTTITHSLSSLKLVIRSKHQISYWLYILKPVKSWVIV